MCWTGTLEKRIATKDIKTFKVGYQNGEEFKSYYMFHIYAINQLYKTMLYPKFLSSSDGLYMISQGFHSYNPEMCSYIRAKKDGFNDYYIIQSKYRGLINLTLDITYGMTSVFECTIPEGSEYYENELGEIVSNQIIINKIIE